MKKLLKITLFLFALGLMTFVACKKEEPVITNPTEGIVKKQNFNTFDWSNNEQDFFSLSSPNVSKVRTGAELVYHPMLVKAYNEIAKQNEAKSFIEDIVKKQGTSIWAKSYVYYNSKSRENLVLIPLSRKGETKVSALISVIKQVQNEGSYSIDAMSRGEILNTSAGSMKQKLGYTKWMLEYDKMLFNTVDEQLKNAHCTFGTGANDPHYIDPLSPSGCEWKLMEWCIDEDLQMEWWGGNVPLDHPTYGDHDGDGIPNKNDADWINLLSQGDHDGDGTPNSLDKDWYNANLPIGDHDGDGILNKNDNDWFIWYASYGDHDGDGVLNNGDQDWRNFEERFPNWENYMNDWTTDFDQYTDFNEWWDENSDNGADLSDFFANLSDIFHEIGDWFSNLFEDIGDFFENLWDILMDLFDRGPDCYDWNPFKGGKTATTRSDVRCEWFYVKDCHITTGSNWWTELVSCPTCSDQSSEHEEQERYARIISFLDKYNIKNSQFNIDLFSTSNCPVIAPPSVTEQCLKDKYIQYLATKLGISVGEAAELFNLHQQMLKENQDYEGDYIGTNLPELGSSEWINILDAFEPTIWGRLTTGEKILCGVYSTAALRIYKNKTVAESETIKIMGHSGLNDKSDAFRHAFFQAINTATVSAGITNLFAMAHESETPPLLMLESTMDIFNNGVGIGVGSDSYSIPIPYLSDSKKNDLSNKVKDKLDTGYLRYLKPININDPNFETTHGITSATILTPTNQ